jgi:hypothetical protein
MTDGLWLAKFSSILGSCSAPFVVRHGLILGSDAHYSYSGVYAGEEEILIAELSITHRAGPQQAVFGFANALTLHLEGRVLPSDWLLLSGRPATTRWPDIFIRLIRQRDVPEDLGAGHSRAAS